MGAGHGHHTATGAPPAEVDRRRLWVAFGLIVAFMAAEVVVGLLAGSLALLADAGHMVSDAVALALALMAMRLAARPAHGPFTYGLKRAEILSALANGAALLGLCLYFLIESVTRLVHPAAVAGWPVLTVALAGIAVNLAATLVLRATNRRSLNLEGGFRHILTDLYAFVGTAIAGVVIMVTGFTRADAIASLVVAGLMAKAGVALVVASGRVILEAAPPGTEPTEVRAAILAEAGVLDVHELHIWEVTSNFPALSAHVLVAGHADCHTARAGLERLLADRFDIRHTTLQVDHPAGELDSANHVDDPGCPARPEESRNFRASTGQ